MSGSEVLAALGLVALSYLLGSLSPSVFLGRMVKGIDLREHGSGNAGTTNAFRVLGRPLGIAVLLLDIAKGFLPVLLARQLGSPAWVVALVALAAILGHNFSIFLRGRGGKGIATGAGAVLSMSPLVFVVILAAFLFVMFVTGYVSLGSLSAAAVFPVLTLVTRQPTAYLIFSVVAAAVVIWAHRSNIQRLLRGEERRSNLRPRRGSS